MDISRLDSDISVGTLEEERPQRINNYGSVVSAYFGSNCFIFDVHTQQLVDLAIFQPSINVFNSCCQIAEPEADAAEVDEPAQQEPKRSSCSCKSSCKTKQKNEDGRFSLPHGKFAMCTGQMQMTIELSPDILQSKRIMISKRKKNRFVQVHGKPR